VIQYFWESTEGEWMMNLSINSTQKAKISKQKAV